MADGSEFQTSATLLGRLRLHPPDEAAWREFEERYGRLILAWSRRWGLQANDAEDLKQTVLLALTKSLANFEYDPERRFRSWLRTVAYRAWCDFLTQRSKRKDAGSGETAIMNLLNEEAAKDDFLDPLEEEWRRELLEAAMKLVQQRVQPHTWEAFRLLTQDQLSGAEVAERLDMKVGAVWVAKSKVQKMLQEEIRGLEKSAQVIR